MKLQKIAKIALPYMIAVIALSCSPNSIAANDVDDFFDKHKRSDQFISLNLPPDLIRMFVDKEEKELRKMLKDLDDIKLLILTESSISESERAEFIRDLKSSTMKDYNDLMIIQDGDDIVEFKVREKNGSINELLMFVSGDNTFVIMRITGLIDLEQMKSLAKAIDVKEAQHLGDL